MSIELLWFIPALILTFTVLYSIHNVKKNDKTD
ncbi:hypothetical protein AN213_00272 [Pseudoalteromonas sp. P1-8]|nr:hypothetical protein AN213_00272 [Pseudoalteromonas sp. P1-8]